jgi:hypothetical protein
MPMMEVAMSLNEQPSPGYGRLTTTIFVVVLIVSVLGLIGMAVKQRVQRDCASITTWECISQSWWVERLGEYYRRVGPVRP